MRHLITLLALIFSSFGIAQNTGLIVGKVLDKESNNEPLIYANVSIKDSNLESASDVTGLFLLENLADGDYTLVCSFVGYETKELHVHVDSTQPTEVNISLSPSTISLDELALLSDSVSKKEDKTSIAINN